MASSEWKFEVLAGLPAIGPLPVQFSATGMGMHREGFVVRFFQPNTGESWVGNFQRGISRFSAAIVHPNRSDVLVVAGGEVYVVDPDSRFLKENFGGTFISLTEVAEKDLYIFGTSIAFEAVGPDGRVWRSSRVAVDGIRNLSVDGETLSGEAWCLEDEWQSFSLDLRTGKPTGGAGKSWAEH